MFSHSRFYLLNCLYRFCCYFKNFAKKSQISTFSGAIPEHFDQSKDLEAVGILQHLYKLGPSVSRLPLLINYYGVLMNIQRGQEADRLVDEILAVIKNKFKENPKTCKRLAKRYFGKKEYFKSILFELIGNHLLSEASDCEEMLSSIEGNMVRLQICVKNLCVESYSNKKTLRLWVFPRMKRTLQVLFCNARGKSKKTLTLVQVSCLHKLEIAEGYVGDLAAVETTLIEAAGLLTSVLGQDAKEMRLLGTLLNNLGANSLMQKRLEDAKNYLTQAIEVNLNAKDFSSPEERKRTIVRSNQTLNSVEEMLAYQT